MAKKLYLQLNEPGSGEISLPLDTAQAQNLQAGGWVPLDYKGTILGGFYAENFEKVVVGSGEKGARTLKVTGRGALSILDDAIVWDWGTPDLEKTRYFYTVDGGRYFTYPMLKKGQILHQLIHEAIEAQTNPYGGSMDRKCWHDIFGTHILAHVFDDTNDSDGVPWDAAESEELEAVCGMSLLELARQFCAIGQPTAPNVFDLSATHDDATGVVTFGIHQTAIGVSLANAIVHFRVGHNCTEVSDTRNIADLRNAILTEFTDPTVPYASTEDAASETVYRRKEMILRAANASSAAEALVFGAAALKSFKDPKRSISLKITDAATVKYGTHYNMGDWIYYDDGTGIEVAYRIVGIQLEWDDNWFADVVVTLNTEFMEAEIRSARDLRKVGAQSSGSVLMSQANAGQTGMAYSTHPPSGSAADGTVLTADGLGRSDWEPVDGGHGMPGGTEHLKFLLHMEGADNSTTIPDEIGAVWTAHGAACLKTAISKFGGSSVIFNTNDYISATVAAPGTADFQLEAWLYPTAFWGSGDNWYAIGGNMRTWNDNAGVEIGLDANGSIIVYNGFNGGYLPGLRTARMMTLNAWNHIALVKISGVYYVYVNGFRDSNTFVNANNISSTSWEWGHGIYQVSDTYFRGYIDEAAYYDYAKWTGWYYDPPTMPYSLTDEVVRGTTIRFRGGDAVNLPTLFTREPFIEEDTGTLHIGPFSYGAGGGGDVVGPAGATDGHVALFDGATGKIIKDGGAPAGGGDVYGDPAGVSGNVPVFDGDGYHLIDSGTTPGGGSTDVVKVTAGVGDIVIPGLAASADIAGAGGAGTSEEYDTSTTGLTWNSAPDVCDSNTTIKSHLYIKTINSSEYLGWKAWSPAGAFDARAKLHLAHITTDTYMDIALMVMNSDNSLRADAYFIRRGSTGVFSIGAATYNGSYSGQGSEEPVGTNFVYARLIRDGSNNFTFLWSSDGILWTQIATVNFTLTVARIGYRISDGAVIGAVDWLRTDV